MLLNLKRYLFFLSLTILSSCLETGELAGHITVDGRSAGGSSSTVTIQGSQLLTITNNLNDVENTISGGLEHLIDGEGGEELYCGYWAGTQNDPTYCSFRFNLGLSIPDGATITSATLSVRGKSDVNWVPGTDYLQISATDVSNAAQISGINDVIGKLNGNIETTNIVRWPASGGLTWTDSQMVTPDIKDVIQELVDKYNGLDSGDAVILWLYSPNIGGNKEVTIADFGHADHSTSLQIEYTFTQ